MKIVVLGAGESGVGAALLAQKKGYEVFVSDKGEIKREFKLELEKAEIPYLLILRRYLDGGAIF